MFIISINCSSTTNVHFSWDTALSNTYFMDTPNSHRCSDRQRAAKCQENMYTEFWAESSQEWIHGFLLAVDAGQLCNTSEPSNVLNYSTPKTLG